MAALSSQYRLRADEAVFNDGGLLGSVAATISTCLGLPKTNPALGKEIVNHALRCASAQAFCDACYSYGSKSAMGRDVLEGVYARVQGRHKAAAMKLQQQAAGEGGAGGGSGSSSSGHQLKMASYRTGGLVSKKKRPGGAAALSQGGARHTFAVPKERKSLLGLDRCGQCEALLVVVYGRINTAVSTNNAGRGSSPATHTRRTLAVFEHEMLIAECGVAALHASSVCVCVCMWLLWL